MSSPASTATLASSAESIFEAQNELYTSYLDHWDLLSAQLTNIWRLRRRQWHAFAEHPAHGIPREIDCSELHAEMAALDEMIWKLEVEGAVDLKADEREADDEGDMQEVDRAEMEDVDDVRAAEVLLGAVENAYGEDDSGEDGGSKKGSDEGSDGDDTDEEAEVKGSSWRKCPVPGCGVTKNRLSRINQHLRDDHDVPLEIGGGGDMVALRARQDAQFAAWCVDNGLREDVPREQPIDGEVL